jgi:hypothetical protein
MRRSDFAALLLGMIAAACLGEVLLHFFWPQRSSVTAGMFESDPAAGYRIRPNYRNEIRVPEYRTAIFTDAGGYRVPRRAEAPPPDCRRILAIGDSFTFGVGVDAEAAFPLQLEGELEQSTGGAWCARNGGVGGYGPLRSARLLETKQGEFRPEIVVHAVYVGNDLLDSNPATYLEQPRIEGGRMVSQRRDAIARARRYLRIHSHLYSFLRANLYELYLASPLAAKSQALDPMGLAEWPAWIRDVTWPACAQSILDIAAWCREHGAHYLVVLVPAKYQVDEDAWNIYRKRWKLPTEAFDRDHAQRVLNGFLGQEGVAALDLLPAFRSGAADSLYFRVDNHWTPAGHALAAREILREVTARGWADAAAITAGTNAASDSARDSASTVRASGQSR